ncbi:YaaR family protein [Paenibacillus chartarius]|uniref:YaaR family protein n=1 Tax=Paenibacillus chartarius TaxID=747481 RepID=A0ABV6DU17_9BACL
MKINPGMQPAPGSIKRADSLASREAPARSFADTMLQQEHALDGEQLNRMAEQIKLQGDRLSRSMTVRSLRMYKALVKQFLEETARRGVGLKETKGWDRRGRTRRYKLLDEIDSHLTKLADELVDSEQGRLAILHSIGEIRGLLINILF